MICDRCFHSVVCKYADQDYDLEECGEFISRDVAEVKHGKWVGNSFDFYCSNCNQYQNFYAGKSNFCPNCGADMRGES